MTRFLKPILVIGSLTAALTAALHGQHNSLTGKSGRMLKTFRVLAMALGNEPAQKLPAGDAENAVWDRAIADCTLAWKRAMKPNGLDFGDEMRVLYDPDTETLSIYADPPEVELLESYTQVLGLRPARIICTLEVLEGPSALVRDLTAKAQPRRNHAAMLRELEALVVRKEAKHVGTLRLETRSGNRSTVQSGPEQTFPRAFVRNEPGAITPFAETRSTGIKLTADLVIGPDGWMTDILYDLEVHHAPAQSREVAAPPLGDSQAHKLQVFDFCLAHTNAATIFNGNDTKLLGVWTPCDGKGQPRHEALQAAFLHLVPVTSERPLNPLVEAKLREHLHRQGRILGVDAEVLPAISVAKGLQRREFKVPRSFRFDVQLDMNAEQQRALFLSESDQSFCFGPPPNPERPAISDPFAVEDATAGRMVTFPEGTDIRYHERRNVLEVVQTEEGLRKIEKFLDLIWDKTPRSLAFSLHIVQADGTILRELGRDNTMQMDHTGTWAKIEELVRDGKATVLSTQRMETRSGQRASMVVGLERARVDAFKKTDRGTIEAKTESKTVGTTWEIDPILSTDLKTIDLNLSLDFHFAPLQPATPEAAALPSVGSVADKMYSAKVQSAYTLQSGTMRLISLWKPTGTPELDGNDVMQAAFLRADVVSVVDRENP